MTEQSFINLSSPFQAPLLLSLQFLAKNIILYLSPVHLTQDRHQSNYYITIYKQVMTNLQQLSIQNITSASLEQIKRVFNEKDQLIKKQVSIIAQLQEKIKEAVQESRKMREGQSFYLFKEKYEQEYQLRLNLKKQVVQNLNTISTNLKMIEKTMTKNLSGQLDLSVLQKSEDPRILRIFNSNCSSTFSPKEFISDTNDMSQKDLSQVMSELFKKIECLEVFSDIFVLKFQKFQLENNNIASIIKTNNEKLEKQLQRYRDQIFEEIRKREQLKRELETVQSEKARWKEGFRKLGSDGHRRDLMKVDRQGLVEEIMRLMYCLKTFEKRKQKTIEEFRQGQKQRYEQFLHHMQTAKR